MKKYLKVGAFCLSLLLIGWLIYVIDFFTGYPVSYFRVQHAVGQYMEENYPDTDYMTSKPSYSLKLGGFQIEVSSPDSMDHHFSISFDHKGNLKYDTYEESVLEKITTASRLSDEYKTLSRDVFEKSDFPFAADFNGSFDEAIAGGKEQRDEPGTYPSKWNTKELIFDKDYDISQLSGQYGTVCLRVTSRDVSIRTASESLLRLKGIMENANLPFNSVELWILSEETDEYDRAKERIHILNFGWDEIYEDGLADRVQEAIDATEAYYK